MNEPIDFDFFDDPPASKTASFSSYAGADDKKTFPDIQRESLKRQKRYSSSSSDESISAHSSDLHGVQSDSEQRGENFSSSVTAQNGRTSSSSSDHKSDSELSVSSHKSSENELYSESRHIAQRNSNSSNSNALTSSSSESSDESKSYEFLKDTERTKSSERNKKHLKIPKKGRRFSSDSMTDVSPLTSPEKSPSLQPHRRPFPSDNLPPDDAPVRHITKLNVVFRNDVESQRKSNQKKKPNRKVLDYHSIQWSSSDSDNEFNHYADGPDFPKSIPVNNIAHSRSGRERSAAFQHRQRLLDSAAQGSMDVSSLLETVLEFEKQNYHRKAEQVQQHEGAMNYHIGEKLLHEHGATRRKNMSFTNEKVREIDQENQRLLKQIRNQSRPSSASSVRSTRSTRSTVSNCSRMSSSSTRSSTGRRREDKVPKLYHSAVNRLQYQRRIERENMQLLKRLQAAKPTPNLQRQRQLSHYKQQSDYMGTSINRNGISIKKANELTRNAEVVQKAMGLTKPVRPTWEDRW